MRQRGHCKTSRLCFFYGKGTKIMKSEQDVRTPQVSINSKESRDC